MLASHWTQESLVGDVSQNHTDALNTPLPALLPPSIFVLFVCFLFQGKVCFLKEDICDRHTSLRVETKIPMQICVVLCTVSGRVGKSHARGISALALISCFVKPLFQGPSAPHFLVGFFQILKITHAFLGHPGVCHRLLLSRPCN